MKATCKKCGKTEQVTTRVLAGEWYGIDGEIWERDEDQEWTCPECQQETVRAIFDRIMSSRVFRLDGPDIDLTDELINLAQAVHADAEIDHPADDDGVSIWSYGEGLDCTLGGLIIGAYWALTEWHGGQWSDEYAALSQLGKVFSPGMTSGPEPESDEVTAYELICEYYKQQTTKEG